MADGSPFEQARAHFVAGVQAFEGGRFADAEQAFVASLDLLPGRVSTLVNLGAARLKLGQPLEALQALEAALAAEPDGVDAWGYRGAALNALGRHEEALACHERVLALRPRHAAAALERAQTLVALQRPEPALQAYEQVLVIDPAHALAWSQRGGLLKDMGRLAEAAHCFRQALAHGGDEALNRYFLASVEGSAAPDAAPRHYVEELFDSYADSFDEHLTQDLGYRTPSVLASLLPAHGRWGAALDLGCGTGLMAPLLAPRCDALDGVDLSSLMLEKARASGQYRALHHAEIVEHLQQCDARYALVVAADVFVYLGDLRAVFAGVRRVLEPGGLFAFSVEEAADGAPFQLRASSRYAHREAYLRGLAAEEGFTWRQLHRATLRTDQRRPIGGLYVLLQRA